MSLPNVADYPVLRRRRFLHHKPARRVPSDEVGTRPAVSATVGIAVLDGYLRDHVIIEPADSPHTVRFAVGVIITHGVQDDRSVTCLFVAYVASVIGVPVVPESTAPIWKG